MKNKEIERLLEYFDMKDQNNVDFSGFNNPDAAKESYVNLNLIHGELSKCEKSFSPFFTDKVMNKIEKLSYIPGIEDYLSMLLTRVMTYGLTAVIIVFMTIYFLHGQEGIGTVLGTDISNDLNFISSVFYEF